ncbi:MAG TPA: aldose 1-epimerase family protein [Miltoncostaeaceae bacterium]|nr:aldose 1-epimerase family protein [Miltoncostaeaceae bacterium]
MSAPSGGQVRLRHGPWEAVVVEVGGGLRTLTHGGAALLDGYAEGEMAGGGRGQVLAPWPNRLAGGTYAWAGRDLRAPLSEPARGNAIHGLVRWSNWQATDRAPDRVTMRLRLHPQPAYPFALDLAAAYVLGPDGLGVTFTAANAGDGPAPFGVGFHPYLTAGTGLVDDAVLTVPADAWLPADDAGIPTGERRPVDGDLDLRRGRAIGGAVLDHCFTGLVRDAEGRATVTLEGPSRRLRLWMDGAFGFVMVFTGDTLPPQHRRRGVAVEPMSCAADAFNSGAGLVALDPGGTFSGSWGIAVG